MIPADDAKELKQPGISWTNVVVAAVLMTATLPGRTQGMGLITEQLIGDLHLGRVSYASVNLWATLLGALFCLPAGWLLDRFGARVVSAVIVLLLGLTVNALSAVGGSVVALFLLVMLTRGLGQSALSVASITSVGRTSGRHQGLAMGIYSVLLTILMAAGFGVVGAVVRTHGWRAAWWDVGMALLLVVAPVTLLFLRNQANAKSDAEPVTRGEREAAAEGVNFTLPQALRTRAFWIFAGATALFGLVSSGLGLFNEDVLKEHGFDTRTYQNFMVITTLVTLAGQFLCGWLASRWPLRRLMAVAMFLYAFALGILPLVRNVAELSVVAVLMGVAAGIVMVTFFAVWGQAFGREHLGRIQGMAQITTVLASAVGPLMFAQCKVMTGSYSSLLIGITPVVLLVGVGAWRVSMPRLPATADSGLLSGAGAS